MRSGQRDQGRVVTFSAAVGDAASGSGVAQPGSIPFTFTRAATGVYDYQFDTRLRTLSIVATADLAANHSATAGVGGATGYFRVVTLLNNATANGNHYWTCTALDRRT